MVILVDMAARFVTNDMAIAAMAIPQKIKLLPPNITAITVKGVRMQPWEVMITASQPKRNFSCPAHQVKNFARKDCSFISFK